MKNTISQRVADFLKNYPPFSFLTRQELGLISEEVSIIYKEKDSLIFAAGEKAHGHFYVIHKGAIAVRQQKNIEFSLSDEGDLVGLRPLITSMDYKTEAFAYEESILYAIPIDVFKPYALKNNLAANFLIESFASSTENPYSNSNRDKLYGQTIETSSYSNGKKILDFQAVKFSKKVITCQLTTPVSEVAMIMKDKKIGAIIVVENDQPKGVITDKDLRNKIVTGLFSISSPASQIMNAPVVTYPKKMTVTQAQIAMIRSDVSYLCLTKDGTPYSKVVGVLSEHDVMVAIGNNPAVLVKAIKRTKKTKGLKAIRQNILTLLGGFLNQNIPMKLTSSIITELNETCIQQVIKIALKKMAIAPPVPFSWLGLGSQGRKEQLLFTDQDNALIYEDVSEDKREETKQYFLELAQKINRGLFEIGYEYCPAEMMASNPDWCLSLQEIKDKVQHWITNTGKSEVLLSFIFFDYSVTYGDKQLASNLSEYIFSAIKDSPIFYTHLASGTLQSPSPTGFFRNFLLEQDGANKDQFDIKNRALLPLVDAARLLIVYHSVSSISNTAERFEKLAELEPQNKELFLSCSYSYKALLKFRTKQGLLHSDSGQYINIELLSKIEKIKLKNTFKTIKDIQALIAIRFNVKNIL